MYQIPIRDITSFFWIEYNFTSNTIMSIHGHGTYQLDISLIRTTRILNTNIRS